MALPEKHISKSFDNDLKQVIDTFIKMGQLATEQTSNAVHSFIEGDEKKASDVINGDDNVNKLEVEVDEQVTLLLARRQPTASDLRLVMAISKGVVDLERVGDEASKIARMAVQLLEEGRAPKGASEVQNLSNQVRIMLLDALDAFARMDPEQAFSVLRSNEDLDIEYQSATRSLMTYIMEDQRRVGKVLNIFWILRALERIGDHARNIAELVIYYTSGKNVRHSDFMLVEQAVQEASDNIALNKDDS